MTFEICATNIQSALAAEHAGGHRIELCSGLDTGGLTPSYGLIRAAVRQLSIPVHVLIRPREGDFCYSAAELDIMLDDIRLSRLAGVKSVVVGALTADRKIDLQAMQAMREAAEHMEISFHRAFDFVADPQEAIEQMIALGCKRVLSSGQANTAFEGREMLRRCVEQAGDRLSVMPGGGITAENIGELVRTTGASEFHFTAKEKTGLREAHIPGLETWYWQSSEAEIGRIIAAAGSR